MIKTVNISTLQEYLALNINSIRQTKSESKIYIFLDQAQTVRGVVVSCGSGFDGGLKQTFQLIVRAGKI